jgi:hypothetical protein
MARGSSTASFICELPLVLSGDDEHVLEDTRVRRHDLAQRVVSVQVSTYSGKQDNCASRVFRKCVSMRIGA